MEGVRILFKLFKLISSLIVVILGAVLLYGSLTVIPPAFKQKSNNLPIYIDNISIVDVLSGKIRPQQNILIVNGKIADISSNSIPLIYPKIIRINGADKFLIPSLWDMHIHTIKQSDLLHYPLFMVNGILNVRDLGNTCSWGDNLTCVAPNKRWQLAIEDKTLLGPKLWSQVSVHLENITEESKRTALKMADNQGDSLLKIQLPHKTTTSQFQSILNQAKQRNLPVLGHLPGNLHLDEVDLSNFKSIEHDRAFYSYCSNQKNHYVERISQMKHFVDNYSKLKCVEVMKFLALSNVAYVPTHIASSMQDKRIVNNLTVKEDREEYIDLVTLSLWNIYNWLTELGFDQEDKKNIESLYTTSLSITKLAQENHVLILAGSDSLDAYSYPGFSLYDELQQLSEAGLSNIDVLRTATINPARYYQAEDIMGSIDVGKKADIVIINNDPFNDLSALKDIDSVIFNGEWYSQNDLNDIKIRVKSNARQLNVNAKRVWDLFVD